MIDYIRTYKQFTSSHYFYEGVRMTAGVMLPVLLLSYYGQFGVGMTVALGAMGVGITDILGPIHHRRNGMLITMLMMFVTIIATGLSASHTWLTILLLIVLPFFFSMIGIYGLRASSAGMACMLMLVFNIDKFLTPSQVFQIALLTLTGGAWYFLLSIGLYHLRPYKMVQQVLGDSMRETARYLRIKGSFYNEGADIDKSYQALAETQAQVHHTHEALRELLFKTSIVKESTAAGRMLVMAFVDIVDLFEHIMTSQQEYSLLHEQFDKTGLMRSFGGVIRHLADDLEELGIAYQEGRMSKPPDKMQFEVSSLEALFLKERQTLLNEENANAFISLRHVLNSIKDLQGRIDILHSYTVNNANVPKTGRSEKEHRRFISRSDYSPRILLNNLNVDANIFRHSVRVCVALLAGYVLSIFLPLGHDYWILLTIIVILKPAYALTRQRNTQRLGGTFVGAALAALILFTVQQTGILIAIIMILMIVTYSFIRVNYFISAICMTAYVIIALHFSKTGTIVTLLGDRIIDTAIGSFISFIFLYLIPPRWEHESIRSLCIDVLNANKNYYAYIAGAFAGNKWIQEQYKLKRKDSYVAMANLGDAFQRMLNEPKSKRQQSEYWQQLVVLNHMLMSHIATLSAYWKQFGELYVLQEFQPVVEKTITQLTDALDVLEKGDNDVSDLNEEPDVNDIMEKPLSHAKQVAQSTDLRNSFFKTISDQFEIILRVAVDMKKIAKKTQPK